MIPRHHPSGETLLSYSAGALDAALAAVVSSHLVACRRCRNRVAELDMLGSILMEDLPPQSISPGTLERAMALATQPLPQPERALTPTAAIEKLDWDIGLPQPVARLTGFTRATIPWIPLASGIEHRPVILPGHSGGDLRFIRIAPGHKLPEHGHDGRELVLVLWGSYADACGQFSAGDIADVDQTVSHEPVATGDDWCTLLFASEKPAAFLSAIQGR